MLLVALMDNERMEDVIEVYREFDEDICAVGRFPSMGSSAVYRCVVGGPHY